MSTATLRINPLFAASNMVREIDRWTTQDTLAETVTACQRGDQVAQRRLFEASHQNVYRLMVRMVGLQDAPDLTQQVFLQAFRKISQFSGRAQVGTWIYRIAVNEALQHLRRSNRTRTSSLEREPMDHSSDRSENVDDKELLGRALDRLDPDLRSTFLLREVEGLSYSEISEALKIPEGTVGSRMNRARRELKQHLIDLGWEPKRELLRSPKTSLSLSRR
jgi:RNA polymerase sigma-70 factor (ECF subfamily)